tara:strand:+ start:404 stop:535 length:132 start_codon:yes stop_codon:yes gene_type:complete
MGKYKAHVKTIVPFEYLKELVKENPNDAELGKKIRQLILKNKK